MENKNIKKAVSILGTQKKMADIIGVSQAAVQKWLTLKSIISLENCVSIEKATDRQVTCEELRPDIDWDFLRNSPENLKSA